MLAQIQRGGALNSVDGLMAAQCFNHTLSDGTCARSSLVIGENTKRGYFMVQSWTEMDVVRGRWLDGTANQSNHENQEFYEHVFETFQNPSYFIRVLVTDRYLYKRFLDKSLLNNCLIELRIIEHHQVYTLHTYIIKFHILGLYGKF